MAKTKKTTLATFDSVDDALLQLGRNEAFLKHEEAILNDGIQNLRDAFDKRTTEARQHNIALQSEIESFCIAHKDEFEKSRSKEMTHGTVSFRTGNPKVVLLNRKYNWNTVIELLKRTKLGSSFLRVKEEIDKEAMLAASAAKEVSDERFASVGVKIDQTENFNIEIKWDTIKE